MSSRCWLLFPPLHIYRFTVLTSTDLQEPPKFTIYCPLQFKQKMHCFTPLLLLAALGAYVGLAADTMPPGKGGENSSSCEYLVMFLNLNLGVKWGRSY